MFQIRCKEPGIQSGYGPALRLLTIQWERQTHAQVNTQNGVHAITDIYCHNPEERARKQGWYTPAGKRYCLWRNQASRKATNSGQSLIILRHSGRREGFPRRGNNVCEDIELCTLGPASSLSLCVCVSLHMLTEEWWRRWQETLRSPLWFKNKIREREAVDGAGGVRGFGLRGWENIMTLHIISIYYVIGVSRHCLPKYGSFYSSLILQRRKQVGWG